MQSDLPILNAEQFNVGIRFRDAGQVRRAASQRSADPLQAMLSAQNTQSPPAPAPDREAPGMKKQKRAVAMSVDDGDREPEKKRARGRPRVAVQDVTAADRRRTQIRLAQRAYRSRRENAIMLLKKKVQALKEANEAMSNAFMNLNDAAISYGLVDQHPGFARQLHSTTEVFLDLARRSSGDEDDDNDEDEAGDSADASGITPPVKQQSMADVGNDYGFETRERSSSAEQRKPTPLYAGVILQTTPPPENTMYAAQPPVYDNSATTLATTVPVTNSALMSMAPSTTFFDNSPQPQQPSYAAQSAALFAYSGQSSPSSEALLAMSTIPDSPYGAIPLDLPLPKSYAALEGSFGLRLLRTALEKAFVLLSVPNPPPHEFARLFGLCIMFEPIEKIRNRVRQGLSRPLELKPPKGRWRPLEAKDDSWPFTSDREHKASTADPSPELWSCSEIPGFENSFYDCDGTEMYLRQRGVHIPPGSDRIVVEVDADDFGGIETCEELVPEVDASSLRSSSSPRDAPYAWNGSSARRTGPAAPAIPVDADTGLSYANEEAMQPMLMFTERMSSTAVGATSIGFSHLTGMPMSNVSSKSSRSGTAAPMRRAITLDVGRFVDELALRATCIVRSPGFRPSDVNEAFWKAARVTRTSS